MPQFDESFLDDCSDFERFNTCTYKIQSALSPSFIVKHLVGQKSNYDVSSEFLFANFAEHSYVCVCVFAHMTLASNESMQIQTETKCRVLVQPE